MTTSLNYTLLALGIVRVAVLCLMAVSAAWLMRRLTRDRDRRRVNPAIWSGLFMLASSGLGLTLLVLRQLLIVAAAQWPSGRWWFLLAREPDLIGVIGYSLCSTLAGAGATLLVVGVHALVYRGASGEVPTLREVFTSLAHALRGEPRRPTAAERHSAV